MKEKIPKMREKIQLIKEENKAKPLIVLYLRMVYFLKPSK